MNARLFRYASVGAMLALSLGSALPAGAAPPPPNEATKATTGPKTPAVPMVGGSIIYDGMPSPQPPSLPSQPFQAQQTLEFGDHVSFAGTARVVTKVTVLMVTWAKQADHPAMTDPTGWTHPITLKLYNVNNAVPAVPAPGAVIASVTQNFKIPWRPTADPTCPDGKWRAADLSCNNGYAFPITFDLTGMNVTVPNQVIYGVSYNTETYGTPPIGVGGPYNSLNIGLVSVGPSVGTDVNLDDVFWNTLTAGWYTDGGAGGVGIFRQDTNWTGYVPAVRFEATSVSTVVVRPGAMGNWYFWNDATDVVDPSLGSFVTGPGAPFYGVGSAQISTPSGQKRTLQNSQFGGTPLSDITELKYRLYNPSAGNTEGPGATGYMYFNIDFGNTNTWQNSLVSVPGDAGPFTPDTWKEFDTLNGGNGLWRYSGANWPLPLTGPGLSTTYTWNQIKTAFPNARILALYGGQLSIRVGSPYAGAYTENIDSVTVGTTANTTIFDFEPSGLTINPSTKLVGVGETFSLDLVANGVVDLFGYQFEVNYDPTKLSATGIFENSFFNTTGGVPPGWNADCTTAPGTCKFAATKTAGAGSNGTGALGRITFTALQAGVWPVTYANAILSDHNALPITSGTQNAVVTVYGNATFNGVVKLQGRATPVTAGTVIAVDPSGTFLPAFVAFNAVTGAYSLVVPAMAGGTNWQITADHSVYLYNQTTVAGVVPGSTTALATQTLWGGDANNDETVTVTDLSCVGGAFNGPPTVCGATGTSDLNADTVVNIFDLVLVGSNYNKVSPQPWQ